MEKIVIIINGSGGVGKDTLCNFAAKHFRVQTISSITPIKEIARKGFGWDGQKDSKSRKLLADLKELAVKYNDLPFLYLCREYDRFLNSNAQILFVHIREGKEIDKFKNQVFGACYTLLITRKLNENIRWGNVSDDNVEKYEYDWIYENNKALKESEQDFCDFLLRQTKGKLYRENIFSKIKNCKKNYRKAIGFWADDEAFLRTLGDVGITAIYDFEAAGGFRYKNFPSYYGANEITFSESEE